MSSSSSPAGVPQSDSLSGLESPDSESSSSPSLPESQSSEHAEERMESSRLLDPFELDGSPLFCELLDNPGEDDDELKDMEEMDMLEPLDCCCRRSLAGTAPHN
jgi:hypothetical protein